MRGQARWPRPLRLGLGARHGIAITQATRRFASPHMALLGMLMPARLFAYRAVADAPGDSRISRRRFRGLVDERGLHAAFHTEHALRLGIQPLY